MKPDFVQIPNPHELSRRQITLHQPFVRRVISSNSSTVVVASHFLSCFFAVGSDTCGPDALGADLSAEVLCKESDIISALSFFDLFDLFGMFHQKVRWKLKNLVSLNDKSC